LWIIRKLHIIARISTKVANARAFILDHKKTILPMNKICSSAKRGVDFRSDWALSWGRPMSRFTRVARSRVSSVTLIPKESLSLHSNQPGMSLKIYSDTMKTSAMFICRKRSGSNSWCTIVSQL